MSLIVDCSCGWYAAGDPKWVRSMQGIHRLHCPDFSPHTRHPNLPPPTVPHEGRGTVAESEASGSPAELVAPDRPPAVRSGASATPPVDPAPAGQ